MKKHALVVDDQVENRYLLRTHLLALGWEVVEAGNGEEALELARANPPGLVLSDILMPELDGYNLCREWKLDSTLKSVPFVFCTATFTDAEDEHLAEELGADGFLREPIEPEEFAQLLTEMERRMDAGEAPKSPDAGMGDTTLLRDYSNVLARKLDHKVGEYRGSLSELRVSKAELQTKSEELEKRVRELTCLYSVGNLARDTGVDFPRLCQETANEIAEAMNEPEKTSVRIRFEGNNYQSPGFRETEFRASFEVCPGCTANRIEVYRDQAGEAGQGRLLEEEEMLIRSLANLLCLEFRQRKQMAQEMGEARRAATLLRLANESHDTSERDLIQKYLEAAEELTGSQIGYLHLVNEDQESIQLVAWSKETLKHCSAVHNGYYPLSKAGIWADCVHTRKPVVHNDYAAADNRKGLPEGHARLSRHMSVPVVDGDKIRMILGVGNRSKPYLLPEIQTMQEVAEVLWRNISRRRVAERLRASNNRLLLLETALVSARHSIIITDRAGIIEWVNPAFTQATGYEASEAIGQNPKIIQSGKHDEAFYADLWQTITSGEVWDGNLINKRKDGTFYDEEAVITPVRDTNDKITHFIAIKEDVTAKHQMERQLLRSQRMESIGLLAGGVAHDLNNVLAPIMMSVELLQQDLPAETRDELIESLRKGCERGAGIIRQVLTFARGVEGERVLVQIRHLVKDLISIAKETFPKNLELILNIPSDLAPVMGDATQLHQVLMNLAVNARDAMPNGGRLEFIGSNVTLDQPRTFLDHEVPPGTYARVQVVDNGMGIPADKLDRIFEPFFTTKKQGKGTGLGLPTTLGIVKSHAGLLEVDSRPGKGSTFSVYLPAIDAKESTGDAPLSKPPRGQGEKILLVDDENSVRTVMGHALETHGYCVITATDGAEAVGIYARQVDEVALVITDIVMPIMDGVAMVRALRIINPEVTVIGCSGFVGDGSDGARVDDLRELGVRTLLEKPFAVDELLRAVAAELTHS